jgi:TonB family protein
MTGSATEVILARAAGPDRLRPMIVASVGAHLICLTLLIVSARFSTPPTPVTRMVINLGGGAPGPRTGGMTQIGGRPVQEVAPTPPRQTPPPARETSRNAIPEPRSKPRPQSRRAPAESVAAAPSAGEEIREGTTPVETRARGTGFGLSSAGGGSGDSVQLDVGDFCCPEYIRQMSDVIKGKWQQNQGRSGLSVVRFTIRRDGAIEKVGIERSSGYYPLDAAAQRAVLTTAQLPPLPAEFTNPTLTVYLTFRY